MRRFKMKKLNNQGSTFILALLVITLLTTLALALANASLSNMMMKSVDRGSKKTFYTSESLLDEVRAGVGHDSVKNLASAYQTVLTNLISSEDGTVKDNVTANKEMKDNYVDNVLKVVTGGHLEFDATTPLSTTSENHPNKDAIDVAVKTYLSTKIVGYGDKAEIKSVGFVKAYKDATSGGYKWTVIIEDVSLSYKEEKAGEVLFSNITADLEIEYPNTTVDFTTSNRLTDFTNYGIIADNSIIISGKQGVNINASVYAGNLIDVGPKSEVNNAVDAKGSDVVFAPKQGDAYINVVCGGDSYSNSGTIRVGGDRWVQSKIEFRSANIWCTNLATRKKFDVTADTTEDATAGAIIRIEDGCSTYVRDDLSVDAQKSDVTIKGQYYGYMIEGTSTPAGHKESSALIVNGRNSVVKIATSHLWLGGRAYIDTDVVGSDDYLTGESLALKGDQEAYLIPSEYLGDGFSSAVSNPMSYDTWRALSTAAGAQGSSVKICKMPANYFAKQYINPTYPYEEKIVNNMVYLYWNFNEPTYGRTKRENAKMYIQAVLSPANSNNEQVKLIKETLNRYTTNLFGGAGSIDVADGAEIYATGILMEASGGVAGHTTGATLPSMDLYRQTSEDLRNRYTVLTHLLVSIPWKDGTATYVADGDDGAERALLKFNGYRPLNDELTNNRLIENLIYTNMLVDEPYNPEGKYIEYGPPIDNKKYVKMAVSRPADEPIIVDPNVIGGIIITTGDIYIDHNFHGLLIAGGDVVVTNDNVTITTDPNMVEDFILGREEFENEDVEVPCAFKQYFKAYRIGESDESSREEVKIENVDYKDLVNFSNWRKYEDR